MTVDKKTSQHVHCDVAQDYGSSTGVGPEFLSFHEFSSTVSVDFSLMILTSFYLFDGIHGAQPGAWLRVSASGSVCSGMKGL